MSKINHPKYRQRKERQETLRTVQADHLFQKEGVIAYVLQKDGKEIRTSAATEDVLHLNHLSLEVTQKLLENWINGYEETMDEYSEEEQQQIENSLAHFRITKDVLAFLHQQSNDELLETFNQPKLIT